MSNEITEKARQILRNAAEVLERRGMAYGVFEKLGPWIPDKQQYEPGEVCMMGAIRIAGHGHTWRDNDTIQQQIEWRAIGLVRVALNPADSGFSLAEFNDRIWPDVSKAAATLRAGAEAPWTQEEPNDYRMGAFHGEATEMFEQDDE